MSTLYHRTSYLKFTADRGPLGAPQPPYLPPGPAGRALPRALPRLSGALSAALAPPVASPRGPLDDGEVALLAHWAAGLRRYEPTDAYPLHRAVPAPRCKYTAELHYVSYGDGLLPTGTYRYDPRRHALEAAGDPHLQAAAAAARALEPAATDGWLVSAVPARLQHVYGEFAARLTHLEAGHVIGQLHLVSAALDRTTRPVVLAPDDVPWPPAAPEVPLAALLNVPASARGERRTPPPAPLGAALDACLGNRQSGHSVNGMYPLPCTLDAGTFHAMGWEAVPAHLRGAVQLHAAAQHVDGLTPGLYTHDAAAGAFRLRRALTPGPDLHRALFSLLGFQVRHCPAVFLLSVNLARAGAFARPLLAAGQVAQRLTLSAAANGLFARPSLSHLDDELDALLGLTHGDDTVAYTVLVGRDRNPGFPIQLRL